jgi:small-conductance mechanosensitive channel
MLVTRTAKAIAAALILMTGIGASAPQHAAQAQALFEAVGAAATAPEAAPPAAAAAAPPAAAAAAPAPASETPAGAPPATAPPVADPNAPPADAPAAGPAPAEGTPPAPPEPPKAADPPANSAADEAALEEIRGPVADMRRTIDGLETDVEAARENDEQLASHRAAIERLLKSADLFLDSLQPRYKVVNEQMAKLGPLPAKDQPAEAPAIAAERSRLGLLAAEIDGAIKATGLVQYRARELLTRVQDMRTRIFTTQLFRRNASPLSLDTWSSVAEALPPAARELEWTFWRWKRSAQGNVPAILALIGAAMAVYFALSRLRRRVFAARLDGPRETAPDFFQRAGTAGWVASLGVLPAALAASVMAFGFDNLGLWFLDSERIVFTVLPAVLIFIAVRALAQAILQPRRPEWRLVDLADGPAASLATAITLIGAVYAIDLLLKEVIRILTMPLSVSVAAAALSSVALAALLFKIARTRFVPRPPRPMDPEQPSDALTAVPKEAEPGEVGAETVSWLAPRVLKIPLLAVAVFILASSLAGYVALGRFVSGQVIVTGSVVLLVILLHLAIRALVSEETGQERALGRVMHDRLGLDDQQSRTVSKLAAFLLDGLLAIVALPFILVTWGYALPDTLAWLKSLVFGFEIGHVRISLVQIAGAIALFAGLLFATRMIQRWINASFLTTARIDAGVANSIHKAIGYSGFALAVLAALSYAGLDITNLAIVAGALSVGIGFGLQSIINNFVSGLILLIERPLKVGDLIVVKGQSGRVRNIAVRSTEIETGDRATLIVPNSELILNPLTNWTHRNAPSSVSIPVKASYRSDPDHVRAVLEKLAAECPLVLQQPKPDASFDNFGADGFEFTLTATVANFSKRGPAASDLRHRIVHAFRDNGIEMPFSQHDVHLRDLDFVKTLLQRMPEAQTPEGRAAGGAPKPASAAAATGDPVAASGPATSNATDRAPSTTAAAPDDATPRRKRMP